MTELSTPAPTLADAVRGLDLRTKAFIDGRAVDAVSGETFDCVSPITGEVIAQVASCDRADVDAAVRGARAAFESGVWSRMAPTGRKRVLLRLAELMREHRDELAMLETIDMGKPIHDSTSSDVPGRRKLHRLLRRVDRQGLRRGGSDLARRRGHDRARAARRGRRGRTLELPTADGLLEARAVAGHR